MFTLVACAQNSSPDAGEELPGTIIEERSIAVEEYDELQAESDYLNEESDLNLTEDYTEEYIAAYIDYNKRQEELALLKSSMDSIEEGDLIRFGGHDWRILDIQDGKALILSDKILSERRFRTSVPRVVAQDPHITWEISPFRRYLNETFYEETFIEDEKILIVETQITTNSNLWFGASGGNDTIDKVFLLSVEEVVNYFGDSGQLNDVPDMMNPGRREASYIDDQYNEVRIAENNETGIASLWWLRSPGYSLEASHVLHDGRIYMGLHYNEHLYTIFGGIRPALWLSLEF